MSDYIITTDAGEKFLSHYGVKGMKWGVRNPETQARYDETSGGGTVQDDSEDEIDEKYLNETNPFESEEELDHFMEEHGIEIADHTQNNLRSKMDAFWDWQDSQPKKPSTKDSTNQVVEKYKEEKEEQDRLENTPDYNLSNKELKEKEKLKEKYKSLGRFD